LLNGTMKGANSKTNLDEPASFVILSHFAVAILTVTEQP
jgi:hypothetical protein